jgi:hypothetical protein
VPDGDRHGWNDFQHYLDAHFGSLARFEDFFLLDASHLAIDEPAEGTITMIGRLFFAHGLFIHVRKILERNDRGQVRTVQYSYHAGVIGKDARSILQYDNAHPHPGHADEHHRHRYDCQHWIEIKPPEWIGRERWPTLGDVIEELYEWWNEEGVFLLGEDLEG